MDTENVITQKNDSKLSAYSLKVVASYNEDDDRINDSTVEKNIQLANSVITPAENLITSENPISILEKEHTEKALNLELEKGIENCMKERDTSITSPMMQVKNPSTKHTLVKTTNT